MSKATELLAKDVGSRVLHPRLTRDRLEDQGAMVQPLGLATQFAMADNGRGKVKHRLTQDLTFSLSPEMSVNSRIPHGPARDVLRLVQFPNRPLHCQPPPSVPSTREFHSWHDYSDAWLEMAHSGSSCAQSIAIPWPSPGTFA
jgi:hypothetical protein